MRRYIDSEGDVWTEQENGSYLVTESKGSLHLSAYGPSLDYVRNEYGPLTELVPSPTDLSAPATRGDVVRLLRALAVIAQAAPEAGAKYASDLADEIKEGRA